MALVAWLPEDYSSSLHHSLIGGQAEDACAEFLRDFFMGQEHVESAAQLVRANLPATPRSEDPGFILKVLIMLNELATTFP